MASKRPIILSSGSPAELTSPDTLGDGTSDFLTSAATQIVTGAKTFNTTVNMPSIVNFSGQVRNAVFATSATATINVNTASPTITCDATTASYTLTLPSVVTVGLVYEFVKVDQTQNAVTLAGTFGTQTNLLLSHPGHVIRVSSTGTAGTWRVHTNSHPLYSQFLPNVVTNTLAETSVVGSAKGFGSMTVPVGFWYPGRRVRITLKGTYQTPNAPGNVTLRVKSGSVVLASVLVSSSLISANSAVRSLLGESVVTCQSVSGSTARLVCDADFLFGIANDAVNIALTTASTVANGDTTATSGTSGATATVDVTNTAATALDVTAQWATAQAGQGTTITTGRMSETT